MLLALTFLVAFRSALVEPALQVGHLLSKIALNGFNLRRRFPLKLIQLPLVLVLDDFSLRGKLGLGSLLAGRMLSLRLLPPLLVFGLGVGQFGVASLDNQAMGFFAGGFGSN